MPLLRSLFVFFWRYLAEAGGASELAHNDWSALAVSVDICLYGWSETSRQEVGERACLS
jgi:hypothetical protein